MDGCQAIGWDAKPYQLESRDCVLVEINIMEHCEHWNWRGASGHPLWGPGTLLVVAKVGRGEVSCGDSKDLSGW